MKLMHALLVCRDANVCALRRRHLFMLQLSCPRGQFKGSLKLKPFEDPADAIFLMLSSMLDVRTSANAAEQSPFLQCTSLALVLGVNLIPFTLPHA
eukprot:1154143-Pelagomonas_calceolata.AAC.1